LRRSLEASHSPFETLTNKLPQLLWHRLAMAFRQNHDDHREQR
jgi:hypothetical protein